MIVHVLICAYLSYTAIAVNFPLFFSIWSCFTATSWFCGHCFTFYLWASALYLDLCALCEVTRTFPLFGYWKIINTKPQYQFFVVTSLAYMTSQAFEVAGEGRECGLLVNFLAPRCPTHRGKESHQSKGVFNW